MWAYQTLNDLFERIVSRMIITGIGANRASQEL
jgi:hypothetical protein